jgi:hypothetical protein
MEVYRLQCTKKDNNRNAMFSFCGIVMATALWDAHPVFSLANGVDDSTSPTNPARNILEQRYKYIAMTELASPKLKRHFNKIRKITKGA